MTARVLFVSHDATRTGSPILLLHILRWLSRNTRYEISTLLVRGGELESEFARLGPVHVFHAESPINFQGRISNRALRMLPTALRARLRHERLKQYVREQRPELVYANTAVSAAFLAREGLLRRAPVICHVHELSFVIESFVGAEAFQRAVPDVARFICVSEAVRRNLIAAHCVSDQKIDIVREPFEPRKDSTDGEARRELGIDSGAFLVVNAGTTEWRKGPDLFIQAAHFLRPSREDARFVWIGRIDEKSRHMFRHELGKFGLERQVQFAGPRENVHRYFAAADVFFLSSREDPYPLVCLEAASEGKPIVCFADSGGMPEFVRDDAGVIVPYADARAAAASLLELAADPARRRSLGAVARARALQESTVDVIGPQISRIIERGLGALGIPSADVEVAP